MGSPLKRFLRLLPRLFSMSDPPSIPELALMGVTIPVDTYITYLQSLYRTIEDSRKLMLEGIQIYKQSLPAFHEYASFVFRDSNGDRRYILRAERNLEPYTHSTPVVPMQAEEGTTDPLAPHHAPPPPPSSTPIPNHPQSPTPASTSSLACPPRPGLPPSLPVTSESSISSYRSISQILSNSSQSLLSPASASSLMLKGRNASDTVTWVEGSKPKKEPGDTLVATYKFDSSGDTPTAVPLYYVVVALSAFHNENVAYKMLKANCYHFAGLTSSFVSWKYGLTSLNRAPPLGHWLIFELFSHEPTNSVHKEAKEALDKAYTQALENFNDTLMNTARLTVQVEEKLAAENAQLVWRVQELEADKGMVGSY